MSSSIFLIGRDADITELRQAPYESEDLLQRLLADHPTLLGQASPAGDRLLLIRREFGVPGEDAGSERWSLDHLFLDQEGVPVLVEVKRATDTRSRREVVAQMLDYAANGVAYWPISRISEAFAEGARAAGQDADVQHAEFLGETEPGEFWRRVEANLRAGRVRIVFVADRIPAELRRIIEFLNEQMRPAEVLAIELKQFANPNGVRTIVPRLLGNTQRAQATKSVANASGPMSEDEWLADFESRWGPKAREMADQVVLWFRDRGFIRLLVEDADQVKAVLQSIGATGRQALCWPPAQAQASGSVSALVLTSLSNAFKRSRV